MRTERYLVSAILTPDISTRATFAGFAEVTEAETPSKARRGSPPTLPVSYHSLPWSVIRDPLSALVLPTLTDIDEYFHSSPTPDGSRSRTIRHSETRARDFIARELDRPPSTIGKHLDAMQKIDGLEVLYSSGVAEIRSAPSEDERRLQLPHGTNLSGQALRLWCAFQKLPEHVSLATIAQELSVSVDTVRRAQKELIASGLLVISERPGRTDERVLVGKIRGNPTPRKSGTRPPANLAPSLLSKGSYKGQRAVRGSSGVPERLSGHTRESSTNRSGEWLRGSLSTEELAFIDLTESEPIEPLDGLAKARRVLDRGGRL